MTYSNILSGIKCSGTGTSSPVFDENVADKPAKSPPIISDVVVYEDDVEDDMRGKLT